MKYEQKQKTKCNNKSKRWRMIERRACDGNGYKHGDNDRSGYRQLLRDMVNRGQDDTITEALYGYDFTE